MVALDAGGRGVGRLPAADGAGRAAQLVDTLRRVRRALRTPPPPPVDHRALGIEAYRERRWKPARRHFDRALRTGGDRLTWLYAASTHGRLKDDALRDACAAMADRLFPSRLYDSRAAFAFGTARPLERDEVAVFLAERAAALAEQARTRVDAASPALPQHAFVYWDTAERPDVVQHCVDSMRRNLPDGMTLVELDATTVGDWVRIDPRITDSVDIPAHAADLIRLHLLSEHGGMWIDASCLLNESFPAWSQAVRAEDFFLFTYAGSRTGNWFIWARQDSYRLQLLRSAMDDWFLSGRTWTNYFQFHDVVEMLYWTDEQYREEWDRGLHLHPGELFDCHRALGVPVSDEEWADVRRRHPINKLSWRKYNDPALRADPATGVARLMAEPLP